MEKKVLLKDLVDTGTNLRKQITSKVRVSDQGVYPIGEIWDANTVIDVIVNGSHEQHDTIRELDEFAHDINSRLIDEIARAKAAEAAEEARAIAAETAETNRAIAAETAETNRATLAEQAILNSIGDLGMKHEEVRTRPWGDTIFGKGNGHKEWGVASVPEQFGEEYELDENEHTTFEISWFQMLLESQETGVDTASRSYNYVCDEASWNKSYQNGGLKKYYEAYPDEDRWNENEDRPATLSDKIAGVWPPYCVQCWKGAVASSSIKLPWIVPCFTEDVNSKIIFLYNEETDIPHTVKSYIDETFQWVMKYAAGGGSLGPGSVTSVDIADGTIQVEDLSDDVKDKLQAIVDEDEENVHIPGL